MTDDSVLEIIYGTCYIIEYLFAEEHIVKKRVKIVLKWVFLVILISVLALVLWNQICKHTDSELLPNAYGQAVEVNGKTMVVDIQGVENETTIILLPGSASASPVLEFLPLAEALSKHYRVITIEPFGYGLFRCNKRQP